VFTCSGSVCSPVPIRVADNTQVYISFYGSGIRNRSSVGNVTCTIGGIRVPVLYAGAQTEFAGLDQVNVEIPKALRGRGEVPVIVTVDGQTTNTVTISIR